MEYILHENNENVIRLVAKYLQNLESNNGLSEFTEDLEYNLMKLGRELTKFVLEYAEQVIFNLKERKKEFISIEKDERKLITIFGEIEFERRYYLEKETEKRIYLLDEYFKLEKSERMLANVEERLIEEAIVTTYEHAGKKAAYGEKITRQTTKNKIAKTKIIDFPESIEKKKNLKTLYIIADEDHVSLQKGGIEEPRFVMVYENFVKQGKRVKLIGKKHFGGLYKGRIDDLWEEVLSYIDNTYDYEKIEKIYIAGDGASWIKTGLGWLNKSIFVLDKFHLKKAVNGIVGKEKKDEEDKKIKAEYKKRIYRSFHQNNFEETKEIVYEILAEEMEASTRERKEKLLRYILNNKKGISNLYRYKKELHGCSAEGHISHVYSSRLSSRPKGWSEHNLDNMSRLRIFKENEGKVKHLIEQRNKVIKFEEIKKIEKPIRKAMKKVNFKPVGMPILTYGTKEEQEYFRKLLSYKAI